MWIFITLWKWRIKAGVEEEVKGDDQFASLSSKWSCHFEKQELVFSTAVQYMESQLGGGQASCRLSWNLIETDKGFFLVSCYYILHCFLPLKLAACVWRRMTLALIIVLVLKEVPSSQLFSVLAWDWTNISPPNPGIHPPMRLPMWVCSSYCRFWPLDPRR